MKEEAEKVFANIVQNKPIPAAKSFKDAIDSKLKIALDVRKVALTSDIYNKSKGLSEKRIDFEKTNKLSSEEYEKVQNFRNFDEKDWEWDSKESLYIRKK
tara:strand:- start:806 stop:1105 length:300 start_codon:yes stop_codon:yes gene_type:complete